MKEANIQTLFGKQNAIEGCFELKLCKTKSIRWDAVKPHQKEALLQAEKGLYHKISDSPIFKGMKTRFTRPKPFDCFFIKSRGFVVICFYIPRKQKNCYYIDINEYIYQEEKSEKKSFTEEEAKLISTYRLSLGTH